MRRQVPGAIAAPSWTCALRGRAVAVAGQDGYFYDVDAHDRKKLFAVVDYDFTPTATLTAGGSYQWDKGGVLNGGVPLYQSGRDSRLPRDTTLAFDWNSYRGSLAETYLQYRQQLGDDWDLKVNTARWRALADYRMGMFGSAIHVLTDEISPPNGSSTVEPAEFTQTTADVTFTGTLGWFGLRHEVAIGADFTRSEVDTHDALYLDVGPGLESVESFDPTNYPDPREAAPFFLESQGGARLDQYGAFASLRTYLGEAWSLTTGARINFNETTLRATIEIGGVPLVWETGYRVKPIVTPFAGVMYALNDHYSLYASYAEIYEGSGVQQSRPGRKMSATRGINYEAGIKASWRGGALNGSMVAYQVEQRDMPVFDELWINDVDDINCCFFTSSTRSRGVDMDLSGEVVRGWLLGAGYTYNVNEQRTGAPLSTQTPKHLFKAWTNYRLPAQLHRWQVGGSVHAQSRSLERQNLCNGTTGICGPYDAVQRSYAVLGLRAAFDLGDSWEIAVKLDNALDKIYYETIDMGFRAWYGDPRHWSLRLDGRF
jgi:outer membrane receptor for ferric coprogen and ferric-rhodotorulic acid